ncbi:hypothetical protein TSOC_003105, partial [Tetrabaena socialis]
ASASQDTDFGTELDQRLREQLRRAPYDKGSDARLKAILAAASGAGAGGSGAGDELDDDVDVAVGGGHGWINDRCPLSMKDVLELEQPVRDSLGYVYESASIREYLRSNPNGMKHPVAGVQHLLTLAELKPAAEVEREKRRRRLNGAAGGANAGKAHDFIDV